MEPYSHCNNPWQFCQRYCVLPTCSSDWTKQGQYSPSRWQQSLSNEKLFNLPEIKQSVIYQQYQMHCYCLWVWINHKSNDNFAQFVSSSIVAQQLAIIYHLLHYNQWYILLFLLQNQIFNQLINFIFSSGRRNCNQMYVKQILCFNEAEQFSTKLQKVTTNLSPFATIKMSEIK